MVGKTHSHNKMKPIKNYFIDESQTIDIDSLKSRSLNKHFKLSTNTIVAFINNHGHESLTFIFEKRCNEDTLLCLSKLFLMTIQITFPKTFGLHGYALTLENHKMSKYMHYCNKQTGIFCHSIILRPSNEGRMVGHTTIPAKEFAITILNQFQQQANDIFLKNGHV